MKLTPWLLLGGVLVLLVWGYGYEQRRQGALKAEIRNLTQANALLKVRAESLSKAKAKRVVVVREARRVTDSVLAPLPLPVRQLILSERAACDQLVATVETECAVKDQQIANLTEQNKKLVKLSKTGKWFGFLPKPRVQVGVCVDEKFKPKPCVSAGFNLF